MFASAMHNNNGTTTRVLVYVQATFCQCAQMSPQLFRRILLGQTIRQAHVKVPCDGWQKFCRSNPCTLDALQPTTNRDVAAFAHQ